MATKIRLKRMGKKFYAFYRVVKGLDGAEGTLKTVEAGPDAAARVEAVEAQAQKLKAAKSEADAKAKAEAEAAATEEAPAEEPAAEAE